MYEGFPGEVKTFFVRGLMFHFLVRNIGCGMDMAFLDV